MGTYTLDALVDAIETTLSAAASLVRSQTYDELTEGIHEYPMLQVYPAGNTGTSWGSETDRYTFRGPIAGTATTMYHSIKEYTIYADVYARQRAHIDEDMGKMVTTVNEIEDILDMQPCPPFGRSEIFSFRWSWDHVTFDYGGVMYVGARFVITVRCGAEH